MSNYKMYAKYTSCLYNVLEDYPNLLDNLIMSTSERTQKFKDMFISTWFNYEVGLETIGLFKLTIENKFKSKLDYYEEKLTAYETEIDFLDGRKTTITRVFTTDDINTDNYTNNRTKSSNSNLTTLPRAYPNSQNSVPSEKAEYDDSEDITYDNTKTRKDNHNETETRIGDEDIIDMKVRYMKQIQNIYEQFVNEFKSCFIQLLD